MTIILKYPHLKQSITSIIYPIYIYKYNNHFQHNASLIKPLSFKNGLQHISLCCIYHCWILFSWINHFHYRLHPQYHHSYSYYPHSLKHKFIVFVQSTELSTYINNLLQTITLIHFYIPNCYQFLRLLQTANKISHFTYLMHISQN